MTKTSFKTAKGALIEIECTGTDLAIAINGAAIKGHIFLSGRADSLLVLNDGRKAPVPESAYAGVAAVQRELAANLEAARDPAIRLSERVAAAIDSRYSNH